MNNHNTETDTEELSLDTLNERRRMLGLDPVDDVEEAGRR